MKQPRHHHQFKKSHNSTSLNFSPVHLYLAYFSQMSLGIECLCGCHMGGGRIFLQILKYNNQVHLVPWAPDLYIENHNINIERLPINWFSSVHTLLNSLRGEREKDSLTNLGWTQGEWVPIDFSQRSPRKYTFPAPHGYVPLLPVAEVMRMEAGVEDRRKERTKSCGWSQNGGNIFFQSNFGSSISHLPSLWSVDKFECIYCSTKVLWFSPKKPEYQAVF